MSVTVAQLIAQIGVSGAAESEAQIGGFGSSVEGANRKLALLAAGGVVALVAVAAKATQMAGDFNAGMTTLVTGAGEAQSNIKMVSDGILQMAVDTGTSTKQLTDGMFMVESAGFHGAAGLDVLKNAAQGAKVGNADLGVVADGVTTIMKDYASQHISAAQATNTLIATVANGKTHMQDLASSMAHILPTAAATHVQLNDVAGAMATMTGEGTPAADAATYLRQTLMSLSNESSAGSKALQAIGLSSSDVANEMKVSLPGTLQMIQDHLDATYKQGSPQYVKALQDIAGGSKQMQGILQLTGTHLQDFQSNVNSVSNAVKQGGNSIQGWSQVQQNFNFQMDKAKEAAEVLMIRLGQQLLPAVQQLVVAVTPAITAFANWISHAQNFQTVLAIAGGVLAGLAVIIAATVVPSLIAMAGGMLAVSIAGAPVWLVALAIAAAVAGVILAIQHWSQIVAVLKAAWGDVAGFFQGIWHGIQSAFSGAVGFFQGVWHGIQTTFGNVGGWFHDRFSDAKSKAQQGWSGVSNFFQTQAKDIQSGFQTAVNGVVQGFSWMYNHNYYFKATVDAAVQEWNRLKAGATILWNDTVGVITGALNLVKSWVTTFWDDEVRGWTVIWNTTKSIVTSLWNDVKNAFNAAINFLWGIIKPFWDLEVSGWTNIWRTVSGIVRSLWSDVTGAFNAGVSAVSGVLSSIWNTISNGWNNLISQAEGWGQNLIQGFINGINNMIGQVGQAAQNVISKVSSFLGFHSPAKEGPGAELDVWGPNMVQGFASGIVKSIPTLAAAMQQLTQQLLVPGLNASLSASSSLSTSISNTLQPLTGAPFLQGLVPTSVTSALGGQQIVIQLPDIVLDGQRLTRSQMPYIVNAIRGRTGARI